MMSHPKRFCCLIFSLLMSDLLIFPVRQGMAQVFYSALHAELLAHQSAYNGQAYVLLEQRDRIIYEDSLGGYNRQTVVPVASVSKWLSTALIMTFVDEGKINLDDPVGKYLPEFRTGPKSQITIRDCLRHTTGYFSKSAFRAIHRRTFTLQACVAKIARELPLSAAPGKVFFYGSVGLQIAARVVEVVSGKSFVQNFAERIAGPCAMEHTSFFRPANPEVAGGAFSCADDLMHFLEMIAHQGLYHGHRVLSEQALQEMQRNQTDGMVIQYSPVMLAIHQQWPYGLGEWIEAEDEQHHPISVSSPGRFGSYPFYDLSHQLIGIILVKGNNFEKVTQADWAFRQAIQQQIAQHVALDRPSAPFASYLCACVRP